MSRPLHRGVSGEQRRFSVSSHGSWDSDDSQMKVKTVKEDDHGSRSSTDNGYLTQFRLSSDNVSSKLGVNENGFASPRSRHKLAMALLKTSLVLIVILALVVSFWWTISITTSSRGHIYHTYRRLQEQLVLDLTAISDLSQGPSKMAELDFCSEEFENFVPCYNVSKSHEYDRQCERILKQSCLISPPQHYRIPLRWPTGRDVIWVANVKISAQEVLSSGSLTKRMMMLDDEQISFRSDSMTSDSIEDYSHQVAEMIGLRSSSNFVQSGVRNILDIECGFGTFGAHLFKNQLLTMCVAPYEASGSQVQLTLERGLPAMIGSFSKNQLPFPSLSYDMVHCARCAIDWDLKDGLYLVEVDRVLRPSGYFVWTSPITNARNKANQKKWNLIHSFAENLCWELLSQQDETVVWKKTAKRGCYFSRKSGTVPAVCSKGQDIESPYYRPLQTCIAGTHSRRWLPIEERSTWPSRANLNQKELRPHGLHADDLVEDSAVWKSAIRDYWSLLSPIIFSDHPKRPGDEDPSPPFNMLRNVLDMNARFGGFNSALVDTKKSVWVMNVVSTSGPNYLPLILDRGFVGVLHDWCEAFPTYPRTYDLVHADGLLTLESSRQRSCTTFDILIEIDRVLRPEGWVIFRDTASLIESTRPLIARLRWESRVIDLETNNDEKLLVCQKPFFKKHAK
ncbi:putative pectin methyltransferase QUA2 [Silene latifolia]|uniref:putative pectin methyltransferase QUA2 n=1 Tax=Silene latifolia TaxID=37657 RepID=UPI003D7704CC